ncbi:hypothetical protein BaRGS_00008343 [Batillaria attramentaria]|uniref:Uncharacterized protein n=1 Tax=Batillaria attramentaria TaxID=370345 RepID=A0ABD0LMF0_9CAEN
MRKCQDAAAGDGFHKAIHHSCLYVLDPTKRRDQAAESLRTPCHCHAACTIVRAAEALFLLAEGCHRNSLKHHMIFLLWPFLQNFKHLKVYASSPLSSA